MDQPDHSPDRDIGAARRRYPFLGIALAVLLGACDIDVPTHEITGVDARANSTADMEVLVTFQGPIDAAPTDEQVALVERAGGRVTHRYQHFPVVAATIPAGTRDTLLAVAGIAAVDANYEMEMYGGKQIVDWGVDRIEAPAAWALGYTGQNVKVGIFDSGIDKENEDLEVAGGVNFIPNSATDPTVDPNNWDDCNGHGTHVGGTVAAINNGNNTVGVAPKAQLYAMRFFDCAGAGATLARELQGIDWAIANGMDVINMSFGCCTVAVNQTNRIHVPLPSGFPSLAEQTAMARAHAAGIVLIAASGNGSVVNGNSVGEPAVAFPAAWPTVVAVGATDDEDMLGQFSQYGSDQELTAPGVAVLSSYLVGMGTKATLTVPSDADRELPAVPLALSGQTDKRGITGGAVYAGLGRPEEFSLVDCVGKIAVVSRGGVSGVWGTFAEKARAAQDAGCFGIVIHNNQPGNFAGTLGTATDTARGGRAWIPGASVSLREGLILEEEIRTRPTTLTLVNGVGNMLVASGTSMASPHAAGVAALVLSKNPSLGVEQVRSVLRASADDLGTPLWDPLFGYGRVNAKRAVQMTP